MKQYVNGFDVLRVVLADVLEGEDFNNVVFGLITSIYTIIINTPR